MEQKKSIMEYVEALHDLKEKQQDEVVIRILEGLISNLHIIRSNIIQINESMQDISQNAFFNICDKEGVHYDTFKDFDFPLHIKHYQENVINYIKNSTYEVDSLVTSIKELANIINALNDDIADLTIKRESEKSKQEEKDFENKLFETQKA